ncbi:hypothetical protein EMPS_02047 [Entomortierella parvispora]|uniref:MYND-type domain-containing protein n=1 Tax=Entomortierella parvispora TaxID=205924 RepID=A0A9P3LT88_9FUNG|nr:hypothetical protein EMPS_02047 [Entomortierella parvispora]
MMTDTVPAPVIPSTEDQLVAATEEVSLEDKLVHVHDENCQHDHEHEPAAAAEPQGRNDYDLLETNGTKDQTTDPLVKIYFEAKEIFSKAMERLNQIPEGADKELIENHKDEIVSVTSDLMRAFLMDEKACIMNQRILKLAEQYETYVQTYNPEGTSTATVESEEEGAEQQTTIYTKDSVVFVIWILFSGQQFVHCVQTLGFAITEFESIRPRMLELRASCHMALRNYKGCTEDLEEVLNIKPDQIEVHSMLGNVYYATHQAQDAIGHFKAFVEVAHPDARTLPNAYYALATLTLQSAPSGATKKKSNQALKQAAALKDAQDYYKKAQSADNRFRELYGVATGFNEIKRTAVMAFQARSAGRNGMLLDDPTPALLDASEALKKSFKSPAISSCANCGRTDNIANEGRSQDLKPKPLIKCAKCSKVAYCSRPCQITHWNNTHKNACNKK